MSDEYEEVPEPEERGLPAPLRDALARTLGMYLGLLEPRYRISLFVYSLLPLLREAGVPMEFEEGPFRLGDGKGSEFRRPEEVYGAWVDSSRRGSVRLAPGVEYTSGELETLLLMWANHAIEALVELYPEVVRRAVGLAEGYVARLPRTSLEEELGGGEG